MDAGDFIFLALVWLCAGMFVVIGLSATRRSSPVHFWSGSVVDPDTVSDISSYNREVGRMWKLYSTPFWVSGPLFFLSPPAGAVVIALASTVGIVLLIRRYRTIEAVYIIKNKPMRFSARGGKKLD